MDTKIKRSYNMEAVEAKRSYSAQIKSAGLTTGCSGASELGRGKKESRRSFGRFQDTKSC